MHVNSFFSAHQNLEFSRTEDYFIKLRNHGFDAFKADQIKWRNSENIVFYSLQNRKTGKLVQNVWKMESQIHWIIEWFNIHQTNPILQKFWLHKSFVKPVNETLIQFTENSKKWVKNSTEILMRLHSSMGKTFVVSCFLHISVTIKSKNLKIAQFKFMN